MTYWLVDGEPWRTRRRPNKVEPETVPLSSIPCNDITATVSDSKDLKGSILNLRSEEVTRDDPSPATW